MSQRSIGVSQTEQYFLPHAAVQTGNRLLFPVNFFLRQPISAAFNGLGNGKYPLGLRIKRKPQDLSPAALAKIYRKFNLLFITYFYCSFNTYLTP